MSLLEAQVPSHSLSNDLLEEAAKSSWESFSGDEPWVCLYG